MIELFSPAKINLFLRILRRREDNYHELASLFQTVSFGDTLRIEKAKNDHFTCSDLTLPTDSNNLVLKALELFRKKTSLRDCFRIHLEKSTPIEAGLGGGSSNAATMLYGVNRLLDYPASEDELKNWSAEIGSDIPFFFSSGTAFCEGRGEIVHSLKPLDPKELWIFKPIEALSTPVVYKSLQLNELPLNDPKEALKSFSTKHPHYFNDMEETAFKLLPRLRQIKQDLLDMGFETVMMSGSGTAFFAIGDVEPHSILGLASYKAQFINKQKDRWYSCV